MNKPITFLLCGCLVLVHMASGQTCKRQYNYEQGYITLVNGSILYGEVANMQHGCRDELLDRVRIRVSGKGLVKKYHPRKISGYTIGNRQFVSWRVDRNNAIFKEMYTIHAGNEHKIFELQLEGHLSIYLEYFFDEDLQIRSAPFFLKSNERLLVRATQGIFGLKNKVLTDYFSDCPPLIDLIEEKKVTTPEEIATFYNNYIEQVSK